MAFWIRNGCDDIHIVLKSWFLIQYFHVEACSLLLFEKQYKLTVERRPAFMSSLTAVGGLITDNEQL